MPKRTMKALWAPWRMEYILGPKDTSCFLCGAIRSPSADRDREHLVLFRDRHGVIVMNRYPYNNGHLLVAPRRHVADLASLTRAERLTMMDLMDRGVRLLTKVMQPDGFNLGYNLGRAGGAGLEAHLHGHIVPRWNGDTNFMPVIGETKVIPQSLFDLYDLLKSKI